MDKKTTFLLLGLIVFVLGIGLVIGLGRPSVGAMCADKQVTRYTVTIKADKASDTDIHAKVCDMLTYVNEDNETREIAFGPHENHVPYDGVAEKFLNKGQSFTITFDQAGNFHWHDHLHDEVQGYFTVAK